MAEQKYEYICKKCKTSEWLQKWRYKQKTYPDLCASCAKAKGVEKYKNIKFNDPCRWKKITKSKQKACNDRHLKSTAEEKSIHAKKMRDAVTISGKELRKRQQDFIDNASKEYYNAYCEKRSKIAKAFHTGMTDEEREKHYRKVFKNNGRSKACDKFLETLNAHNIKCQPEEYVNGFIVDAIIHDTNIIIEFYGDIFHCNPRRFKEPTQYCSWISRTVQEQWDRDRKRLAALYKLKYKVIIVWEHDWNKHPEKCITRIQNEMYEN